MGVIIYDWIQIIIMVGIFTFVCQLILRETKSKVAFLLTISFYAFFPFNPIMTISSTKDVIFSGLCVLYIVFLKKSLDFLNDDNSLIGGRGNKLLLIVTVIIATLMLCFRNNAPYAYILFTIFAFVATLMRIINKKSLAIIIVGVVLYFIVSKLLVVSFEAKPGPIREIASIPSVMMGRIYTEKVADKEDLLILNKYVDLKNARYNKHLADGMKGHLKCKNVKEIVKMSLDTGKLFFKHPLTCLDAILYLNEGAWYVFDTSHAEIYGKGLEKKQGYLLTDIKSGYGIFLDSKIPVFYNLCERLFSNNEYQKNPLISLILTPAFYNWIYLICLVSMLYQRKNKEFFVASFLLCLIFTNVLGPCTLVRYFYPIIICTPLMISWNTHS